MFSIDGLEIPETNTDITEYKNTNWKEMNIRDWLQFAKANKSFGEPGISYDELKALHEGCELAGRKGLRIVETGMCYGTTTRYFTIRVLKYGGELHSFEVNVREGFKKSMEELGLWSVVHYHNHSIKSPWDKSINLLFIDSEHALSDALGEYVRFRPWMEPGCIIGFHDSDSCPGVVKAIEMVQEMDELELVSESSGLMGRGLKMFRRVTANRTDRPWNGR